jgi:assimilatory nitrate reductase catalytic subunit
MTRTGRSPRLSQHLAEPYAEIHPGDARRLGIRDADLVRVESAAGSVLVRAWLSARQAPGSIFVPMHWNDQFAADARVDRLVPGITDPHSGQPASKNVPIRVERYAVAAYGFAVLAGRPAALNADYWAIARCEGGWRVELGFADAQDWSAFAAGLFGADQHAETLAYHDATGGQHRFACFAAERLLGALYIAAEPVAVSRNWACEQLVSTHRGQRARMAVIVGRPGAGIVDRGATVCSCFGVGVNQIASAIADGCRTIEAVGAATQAGSNCGSCRAEIRSLIEAHSVQAAE